MYFRRKQSQGRFYLQIVESHRTGDQVRQRVIGTELESSPFRAAGSGTGGWERHALPPSAIGKGSGIMKKIFATLAVLSLVAGTVALLAPTSASSTWLF
jgi:hypothetical protein